MKHPLFFIKLVCLLITFSINSLSSGTSYEVFQRHLNPVFIETGCFFGAGIENAISAGFPEIHSIELSNHFYTLCKQKFKDNRNVHLHLGDSSIVLKEVLSKISDRTTFWLDGHFSACDTAKGETNTPILAELTIISNHPIKNHTILIDDVRLFGTPEFDSIKLDQIIDKIRLINPDYQFSFEDGHVPNDVLVAEIR